MNLLVIQHSAADSPAAASAVIERPSHSVRTVRIDQGDAIPETVDTDALMMFGGAISLTGPSPPPWVAQEQTLIRDYVAAGKRVLGICLGSQMIAAALGARVRRNEHAEIGWHEIEQIDGSSPMISETFPASATVLQWHQDTFELPPGARQLFRSRGCENQGFTIDDRVLAFQFHLEANRRTVDLFMAVSKQRKREGPFVQSDPEINAGTERNLATQSAILKRFVERWLAA